MYVLFSFNHELPFPVHFMCPISFLHLPLSLRLSLSLFPCLSVSLGLFLPLSSPSLSLFLSLSLSLSRSLPPASLALSPSLPPSLPLSIFLSLPLSRYLPSSPSPIFLSLLSLPPLPPLLSLLSFAGNVNLLSEVNRTINITDLEDGDRGNYTCTANILFKGQTHTTSVRINLQVLSKCTSTKSWWIGWREACCWYLHCERFGKIYSKGLTLNDHFAGYSFSS